VAKVNEAEVGIVLYVLVHLLLVLLAPVVVHAYFFLCGTHPPSRINSVPVPVGCRLPVPAANSHQRVPTSDGWVG
jgi:hypothetical protein